uniref:Uncharacterized protein n=2 Tax=Panagrolaimus sp. JU765 TaxID=591449 RepID=A0AC34QQS5_9BILA
MGANKNLPDGSGSEEISPASTPPEPQNLEETPVPQPPPVRMRNKTPITAGTKAVPPTGPVVLGDPAAAITRTITGALYEVPPEVEEQNEEIRKLDSQLDHLNDYMDKMEERLRVHNEKMTQMLKEQREEREKRRQSFHERMQQNKQEDDEFHQQLAALLGRVNMARNSVIGNISE